MENNYPEFIRESERDEWNSCSEEHKEFLVDSYNYYLKEYKDKSLHPESLLRLKCKLSSGA